MEIYEMYHKALPINFHHTPSQKLYTRIIPTYKLLCTILHNELPKCAKRIAYLRVKYYKA